MNLKFDKRTLDNHIKVFEEEKGRKPYLICSEATYDLLKEEECVVMYPTLKPEDQTTTFSIGDAALKIESVNKPVKRTYNLFYTMYIDNGLKTGEVILA